MLKSSILWPSDLRNDHVFEDMQAEARSYLAKYLDIEMLMADIKAVAQRNVIFSQAVADRLIDCLRPDGEHTPVAGMPTLSVRELEVLRLVAGGASNGDIADHLYICDSTVKAHLRNIMDKMQVKNRTQAVAKAISNGVLEHDTLCQEYISSPARLH